jgi:uncharacterized protein (DUF58 family)
VQELRESPQPDGDLFAELRPWRPEEGWKRVDWKAKARGRGLLAKRFQSPSSANLWLAPTPQLPLEQALEHLCDRLMHASTSGQPVGLLLPDGQTVEPGSGHDHFERCLRALAEWPPCL